MYTKSYVAPVTILVDFAIFGTEVFNNEGVEVAPVDNGENNPLRITHTWTTDERGGSQRRSVW